MFDLISTSGGRVGDGERDDLAGLIQEEFEALQKVFHLPLETQEDINSRVAMKLLNLYRTGRLGHYTLDPLPSNAGGEEYCQHNTYLG